MTYGPALTWRLPFLERIELKKPGFSTVFISLCVAVGCVFLISCSYYSSLPVRLKSKETEDRKSVLASRSKTSNASEPKVGTPEYDSSHASARLTVQKEKTSAHLDIGADLMKEYGSESVSNATDRENTWMWNKDTRAGGFHWNDTRLNILHMPKPEYEPMFQNPCWYEELLTSNPYENNTFVAFSPSAKRMLAKLTTHWVNEFDVGGNLTRLRCLPYFLIIGQPKCGTTDLFWKISKHPDVETPPIKELHWWSRSRQGRRFSYSKIIPFEDYIDMFDRAALNIERRLANISIEVDVVDDNIFGTSGINRNIAADNNIEVNVADDNIIDTADDVRNVGADESTNVGRDYRRNVGADNSRNVQLTQKIAGEASVSLFWDNNEWKLFPENLGLSEPLYIVPHYIHHIIPDVKLIIMLRDPVERMYSDYLFFHSTNKSADDFHSAVTYAIRLYRNCTAMHSVRHCIYDTILANKVRVRLRLGIYSEFLKDWLKLFPRQQLFILRLEDYSRDPIQYVKQIHTFLQIRQMTTDEEEKLLSTSSVSNARKSEDKMLGGMHEETRALLHEFYKVYNQELAQLLGNTKFLWRAV